MTKSKPVTRPIDFDAIDRAVTAHARQHGVPSTRFPDEQVADREGEDSNVTVLARPKAQRSPSRRIHIDTPLYAIKELKDRATAEDQTMRYIVLTALRSIGIDIKDIDMVEDGRRVQS